MTDGDRKTVFVVHGRNERIRKAMFDFLRSLELHPIEWGVAVKETGESSPYVGDVLTAAFKLARAVVVLFTPDDEVRLRKDLLKPSDPSFERELTPQARPNVLFEAGMAMGINQKHTILVEFGPHRPFSDIHGRHVVRLNDNSPQSRQALLTRLESAGCEVNRDGADWISTGDFECWAAPADDGFASNESAVDRNSPATSFSGRQLSMIVTSCSFIVAYTNDDGRTQLDGQLRKLVKRNLPHNDLELSIADLGDALEAEIHFRRVLLKSQIDEFERRVRSNLNGAVLRWLSDYNPAELLSR